jgi:hypothetical protein
MVALFVALGIMVLALLVLLLWFVPHLLQQQATRVASETSQLREMLLDVLSEQEAVTMRQTQLGSSLSHLQEQLTLIAETGVTALARPQSDPQVSAQLESRLSKVQEQIQMLIAQTQYKLPAQAARDNESWANLLSLLATIQERVGALSRDQSSAQTSAQARELLEELEEEMHHLRSISEEIAMLQWRLRRSLHERQSNLSILRTHTSSSIS